MTSKTKSSKASLLFHPKKKPPVKQEPDERQSPSPRKSNGNGSASPKPIPKPIADEDDLKLPDGPYQEFRLMSSALNGWKYDVMKFDSRKTVDISTWDAPIKLNRKELKREEGGTASLEVLNPMLGSDGKPVIGSDGRIVMVDAEGRPIQSGLGEGSSNGKDKAKAFGNGRKKFQKKTRQVYLVPEATRQLRREERYPWVIEDAGRKEVWVGKLEEVSKSETHGFFMPAAADVFKFVPAHRWYKFQKKPSYHIPDLEEAESIMSKMQKNKDPERWLLHHRNGKGPSAATAAIFKAEAEGRILTNGSLMHGAGQSLGPGGRKLRTVDTGGDLFGDDETEDANRRKETGADGDIDEEVYEDDFADDEEKMEDDGDDEEARELEERLKKEYRSANKQREGHVDESEDEEEESQLTKDGKAMKKLIRNLEKNNAYDSDEDKNPYASSEEEEEEERPATNESAIQQQSQTGSRSGSQTPSKSGQPSNSSRKGSRAGSRASSPVPNSPSSPALGGHSMMAKRATSPKAPKIKSNGASRGTSPLAGSRATSPNGSRATSPSQSVMPQGSSMKSNNKRKAMDDISPNGAPPKAKKRKSQGIAIPAGELDDKVVVEWFRNTPNATTRDCIQHFTPYLTNETKKRTFTALIKEVAQLKGGKLTLRDAYRVEGGPSTETK